MDLPARLRRLPVVTALVGLGLATAPACVVEPAETCDANCEAEPEDAFRGGIVSDDVIASFTTEELIAHLEEENALIATAAGVEFPVDVHRVVYDTIDAKGERTVASGIVAIPSDATHDMPLMSYQHGTMFRITDAPSINENGERIVCEALAGAGYLTVAPDYLGLGQAALDNDMPLHPYIHADSEATATIDLMRAARTIATDAGFSLSGDVFLAGYSQGGHATMATAKAIGTDADLSAEFTIKGAAPMAGPYDVSGVQAEVIIADEEYTEPAYLPYIIFAWNEVYGVFEDPSEIFIEPYATDLPPLFDGTHSGRDVENAMTQQPNLILQPDLLEIIKNGDAHPMRDALEAQDLTDWAPDFPVRMYHCEGDMTVLYGNAEVAQEAFEANGSTTTEVVSVGAGLNHVDCALPTLLDSKGWLDDLVRGGGDAT